MKNKCNDCELHPIAKKHGYKSNEDFYKDFPTEDAYVKKYPNGGEIMNSPANKTPIQAEMFQGQPEQMVLPNGDIESTDARTSHENMGDNTITDVVPEGTHIQSSRNKLTPEQYNSLLEIFGSETKERDSKQIEQVYKDKFGKKKNKELSPSDISEYAKNKYQRDATPNSFDTKKLTEGNKENLVDLSIKLNEYIKAGKDATSNMSPEMMPNNPLAQMAYGGNVRKYAGGTGSISLDANGKEVYSDDYKSEEFLQILADLKKNLPNNYFIGDEGSKGNTWFDAPRGNEGFTPQGFPRMRISNENLPYNDEMYKMQKIRESGLENYIQSVSDPKDNSRFYGGSNPHYFERYFMSGVSGKDYEGVDPLEIRKEFLRYLKVPATEKEIKKPGELYKSAKFQDIYNEYLRNTPNQRENPFNLPGLGDTENMIGIQHYQTTGKKLNIALDEDPLKKTPKRDLSKGSRLTPEERIPGHNRYVTGAAERNLYEGLGARNNYLQQLLGLNPVHQMETPDTYIRSQKTEIPEGNILYNIEKAQRNANNMMSQQTGDFSSLMGNIGSNAANAYNQVGDQLTALNEKNINLYNTQQGDYQGLLTNNMGVRNQNLANMVNMDNYKRNLVGEKGIKDAELYNSYYNKLNENSQMEQNQKLSMLSTMASKPDMFKGAEGQKLMNQIMGTTGQGNNIFDGSWLGMLFNGVNK